MRKDYEDGIYDDQMLASNVYYGGRAFTSVYVKLKPEIEQATPALEDYEQYFNYFGAGVAKKI